MAAYRSGHAASLALLPMCGAMAALPVWTVEVILEGVGNGEERVTHFGPGEEPIYDEDGHLVAVGYTPSEADRVGEFLSHERRTELHAANEAARRLAPSLVGLTVAQAQQLVDQHADISVAFRHPGRPYQTIGVFGQIDALVVDGAVTQAE